MTSNQLIQNDWGVVKKTMATILRMEIGDRSIRE